MCSGSNLVRPTLAPWAALAGVAMAEPTSMSRDWMVANCRQAGEQAPWLDHGCFKEERAMAPCTSARTSCCPLSNKQSHTRMMLPAVRCTMWCGRTCVASVASCGSTCSRASPSQLFSSSTSPSACEMGQAAEGRRGKKQLGSKAAQATCSRLCTSKNALSLCRRCPVYRLDVPPSPVRV
jgi:hypothetical protein